MGTGRATLNTLAGHEIFGSDGRLSRPFEPVVWYRRTGCTDEFWFPSLTGQSSQAVVFRATQRPAGGWPYMPRCRTAGREGRPRPGRARQRAKPAGRIPTGERGASS